MGGWVGGWERGLAYQCFWPEVFLERRLKELKLGSALFGGWVGEWVGGWVGCLVSVYLSLGGWVGSVGWWVGGK